MLSQFAKIGISSGFRQSSRCCSSITKVSRYNRLSPKLISGRLQPCRFNSSLGILGAGIHSERTESALDAKADVVSSIGIQSQGTQTPPSFDNVSTSTNAAASGANETTSEVAPVLQSTEAGADPTVQALQNLVVPEPPAVPATDAVEAVTQAVTQLAANGEPTLASLGLANSWWPSSWVQMGLEHLHCDFGLPWWGAILAGTVVIRLVLSPLVIKSQRNAAKMQNNMPGMQVLQMKINEARLTGNQLMVQKYTYDLMNYMKEKEISPFKQMLVPIAMAPVFMSFFFGLRGMANLPLESMKTGGLWWFSDLTIPDPYYILPLVTSATLFLTLKTGIDGAQAMPGQQPVFTRYAIMAIPVIIFPFSLNFPAALTCYWTATNAISLAQAVVLRIPAVRDKLKIDRLKKHDIDSLPLTAKQKKQGFVDSMKESWTNMKIQKQLEERDRFDGTEFARAGRAPIIKTYKYDPTKVKTVEARTSGK